MKMREEDLPSIQHNRKEKHIVSMGDLICETDRVLNPRKVWISLDILDLNITDVCEDCISNIICEYEE